MRSHLQQLSITQLEELAEALLDVFSIADMITWLQSHQQWRSLFSIETLGFSKGNRKNLSSATMYTYKLKALELNYQFLEPLLLEAINLFTLWVQ